MTITTPSPVTTVVDATPTVSQTTSQTTTPTVRFIQIDIGNQKASVFLSGVAAPLSISSAQFAPFLSTVQSVLASAISTALQPSS